MKDLEEEFAKIIQKAYADIKEAYKEYELSYDEAEQLAHILYEKTGIVEAEPESSWNSSYCAYQNDDSYWNTSKCWDE